PWRNALLQYFCLCQDEEQVKRFRSGFVNSNCVSVSQMKIKKSEETRTRILEAALGVFRERGFERATMRDVAAAAGVAVGAAYYYFESKDAIVMAFYERSQSEMRPQIEALLD